MLVYGLAILGALVTGLATYALQVMDSYVVNATNVNTYMAMLGTMFAVMSGFVILLVLSNYREIRRNMGHEVNALQDVRDFLIYLDDDPNLVSTVETKVYDYVRSIIDEEWPRMVRQEACESDTSQSLYALMRSIKALSVKDENDTVALDRLMNSVADVTSYRTARLESAREQLPRVLKYFLLILSAVLLLGFALAPFESAVVGAGLNGLVGLTVAFIVAIIWDLNTPFEGEWNITAEPYEALLERGKLIRPQEVPTAELAASARA